MNSQVGTTWYGLPIDTAFTVANVFYLIFVALALVSSVLLWRVSTASQADKDRQLQEYQTKAEERIYAAQLQGSQALERASLNDVRSNELAADAARATSALESSLAEQARLRLEIEQEKKARAAFEAEFSWRILTVDDLEKLTDALKTTPHSVVIEFPSTDQEAGFFAQELNYAFSKAGWSTGMRGYSSPPPVYGMTIPGLDNVAAELLRKALRTIGIDMATFDVPFPGMFFGTQKGEFDARLVIGPKLNPQALETLVAMTANPPASLAPAPPAAPAQSPP